MNKEREFNWGNTPTMIIGRLDHFISAPVWFDNVGEDDNIYDSLNLDLRYRTHRLKTYHTWDAIHRNAWLDHNISSVLGQLLLSPSKLWVVDGYPKLYLDLLRNKFEDMYIDILGKDPPKSFFNQLSFHHVSTEQRFKNSLTAAEAEANSKDMSIFKLGEKLFSESLPEMIEYHSAINRHHELKQMELRDKYTKAASSVAAEPMTQEEIDALLNGDDDDDKGGSIQ